MKPDNKINLSCFRKKKKNGEPIVALTAYDAPTAKLAAEAGVDLILVGDSLGMAVLGYENTVPVTLEQSLHHCSAVRRGAPSSFIVGDMPFMTYRISPEQAMENAARYLQDSFLNAVKVEGGSEIAFTVESLVTAGVPVMGHIGLMPQQVLTTGYYRIAGRTEDEAEQLLDDAKALEDAGAFSIVLEGIPAAVSAKITSKLKIPTIGIGAGSGCDGQIQVVNDILGLFSTFVPKHSKRYANLDQEINRAITEYVAEVKDKTFPSEEHSF